MQNQRNRCTRRSFPAISHARWIEWKSGDDDEAKKKKSETLAVKWKRTRTMIKDRGGDELDCVRHGFRVRVLNGKQREIGDGGKRNHRIHSDP